MRWFWWVERRIAIEDRVELALEEVDQVEWATISSLVLSGVGLAAPGRWAELCFEHFYRCCNGGRPHP